MQRRDRRPLVLAAWRLHVCLPAGVSDAVSQATRRRIKRSCSLAQHRLALDLNAFFMVYLPVGRLAPAVASVNQPGIGSTAATNHFAAGVEAAVVAAAAHFNTSIVRIGIVD